MPVVQKSVGFIANRLPKVISPTQHAWIDYAVATAFFAAGSALWTRHRRAALTSFLCGAATAASSVITEYPGGLFRLINFETHGQLDAGLAGMTALIPRLMGFDGDRENWFFELQGAVETAANALTDFRRIPEPMVTELPKAA